MTNMDPIKGEKRRKKSVSIRRYHILGAGMMIMILVIFGSALKTMFVDGSYWRAVGERQLQPRPVTINPVRGNIYSSDGEILAITAPYYRLYFDFRSPSIYAKSNGKKKVKAQDSLLMADSVSRELDTLSMAISRRLATTNWPLRPEKLRAYWEEARRKRDPYCPVVRLDLSYLEVMDLYTQAPLNMTPRIKKNGDVAWVSRPLRNAIIREERSTRINPFGSLGLRSIGHLQSTKVDGLSRGKSGIEEHYDSLLRGEVGQGVSMYNAGRYMINTIKDPMRGSDVYMTLNMHMQSVVENALRDMLITSKAESGTVVLMEVRTGQIKAITNLGLEKSSNEYREIMNYAVSDQSPPGSTFKTLSLLVALQDGKCSITDTIDVGNGRWNIGGETMEDWTVGMKLAGFGRISLADALAQSSNVAISKVIHNNYGESDPARFVNLIRATGFTDDFALEIKGSTRAIVPLPSEIPAAHRWKGTWAWMAHGYETQVPPIATLAFYNAIANGGTFVRPHFVSKVMRGEEVVKQIKPVIVRQQIASPKVIADLQDALRRVVLKGTAKAAQSKMVSISGKTGTAVITPKDADKEYQISFACYFPSEAPRYSLIVVIRKPSRGYTGAGMVCGAVAKKIAEGVVALESSRPVDSLKLFSTKTLPHILGGSRVSVERSIKQMNLPINVSGATATFLRPIVGTDGRIGMAGLPSIAQGTVPDLRGLAAMDAVHILAKTGYASKLLGYGMVVGQSSAPGARLPIGSQVVLQLNKAEGMNGVRPQTKSSRVGISLAPDDYMDEALTVEQVESFEAGKGQVSRPKEDPDEIRNTVIRPQESKNQRSQKEKATPRTSTAKREKKTANVQPKQETTPTTRRESSRPKQTERNPKKPKMKTQTRDAR